VKVLSLTLPNSGLNVQELVVDLNGCSCYSDQHVATNTKEGMKTILRLAKLKKVRNIAVLFEIDFSGQFIEHSCLKSM